MTRNIKLNEYMSCSIFVTCKAWIYSIKADIRKKKIIFLWVKVILDWVPKRMSTKYQLPKLVIVFMNMINNTMTCKKMLTFQAMSTFSAKQLHMGVLDHQWRWRLPSPISSDPGIQKPPPSVHLLSLRANQSAWEQLVHQPV